LTVTQPFVVPTTLLVIKPVVGASFDTTVTWLELFGPNTPAESPWPDTLTMFLTVRISAWVTVKAHDPVVAMSPSVVELQVVLLMETPVWVPAAQAARVLVEDL